MADLRSDVSSEAVTGPRVARATTTAPVQNAPDVLARNQSFLLLRYTLIAATAYLVLVEGSFALPSIPVLLLIATALASNVAAPLLPRRIVGSRGFTTGIILFDTVWITAVLMCSGRFTADFFYLYFFVLLLATIGENLSLIAVASVVVCGAYVYVLAVNGKNWSMWHSPSIIRIPFLFTASAFYGYLVDRMRHEERRAAAAQTTARATNEFLATVSHEMRTPMTGMMGWAELLLDSNLTEQQRQYAEGVQRSGDALVKIINDVLDFSKIEAGKLELETIEFEPRQVVDDVAELFAGPVQRKGVELAYWVDEPVPAVLRGDPGRLRQVLLNLVGNAVKFTEQGEIVLRVAVCEDAGKSVLLRFEVADTGIGLTAEQRGRLFHAFVQGDRSTFRKHGGTGLGLTISKRLAGMMGGEIGVESTPGQGSTFWFTARLLREPDSTAQPPAPAPEARGLRLLVVDDSETCRSILDRQLRVWGMHVDTAADGSTALAWLRAAAAQGTPYDAALVDLQMRGMDGRALAAAIRADRTLAAVQIVLLAPVGQRGQLDAAHPDGVVATMAKPVQPRRLCECLAALAAGRGSAESPRRAVAAR